MNRHDVESNNSSAIKYFVVVGGLFILACVVVLFTQSLKATSAPLTEVSISDESNAKLKAQKTMQALIPNTVLTLESSGYSGLFRVEIPNQENTPIYTSVDGDVLLFIKGSVNLRSGEIIDYEHGKGSATDGNGTSSETDDINTILKQTTK